MFEEVFGERYAAGLEDGDGGGSTKGEVAFFLAFGNEFLRYVGLVNGADTGGTDFENEYGAEIGCF